MKYQENTIFAGRYKLIRHLGTGGFAVVWKAEDLMANNGIIAIKIFAPDKGLDANGIEVFRKEYAITIPLRHNHLLTSSYFDIYEGSPFLIMPFCTEGSLMSKIIKNHEFEEKEIADIILQLADGLHYLHQNQITHQDLKPDYVMIIKPGYYALADFGISSRIRRTIKNTIPGHKIKHHTSFTPAYAPPEKYTSKPIPAGDIFSLGITIYECLTGDVPFDDVGTALERGASIPALPQKYSAGMNDILQLCMAINPGDRPTANNLHTASKVFLENGEWSIAENIAKPVEEHLELRQNKNTETSKELTFIPSLDVERDVIGRNEDINRLSETINQSQQHVLVMGLVGIGKTTLAKAYVQENRQYYNNLIWLEHSGDLVTDVTTNPLLSMKLKFSFAADTSPLERFKQIMIELGELPGKGLMVIDNAENELASKEIYQWLPSPAKWKILLTSRQKLKGFQIFPLGILYREAGIELFSKYYSGDIDGSELEQLLDYIGDHTLTIELCAKTLEHHFGTLSIVDLLDHLKERKLDDEHLQRIVEISHSREETELYTHLTKSFDLVNLSSDEIKVLKQFVLLPPKEIPFATLIEVLKVEKEDLKTFSELLRGLHLKGRIEHIPKNNMFYIHRVVREILFYQLKPSLTDAAPLIESVSEMLIFNHSKDNPVEKFKWIPYGESLLNLFLEKDNKAVTNLKHHLAGIYFLSGQLQKAANLLEGIMKPTISDSREMDFLFADRQTILAMSYGGLGQYQKAAELFKLVVEAGLRHLKKEDPTLAIYHSNLAYAFYKLGEFEKAIKLEDFALESCLSNYGKDHPAVSTCQSHMAMYYRDLGQYVKAAGYLESALESGLRNFGKTHPHVTDLQSLLSMVYMDLGQYEKAEKLAEKALESALGNFGKHHKDVARMQSNMAMVYNGKEQFEKAVELLKIALESYRRNFNEGHPMVAKQYARLARVSLARRQYEETVKFMETALDSLLRNFGEDHHLVAKAQRDLGSVFIDMDQSKKATELIQKSYYTLNKKFGPDHPDTKKAKEVLDNLK